MPLVNNELCSGDYKNLGTKHCKKCNKNYFQDYRKNPLNLERLKIYAKDYQKANRKNYPSTLNHINKKIYEKKYYEKHSEKIKLKSKKYYIKNKVTFLDKCKKYRLKNTNKIRVHDKLKQRKYRKELHPSYIKARLRDQLKGVMNETLNNAIDAKRELLLIHREIKKVKNG